MDKVSQHQSSGTHCECEIEPRDILGQLTVGGFIQDGLVSSLHGKNQCNAAIGSRVIARGYDFSFGEPGASEVTVMHRSSSEAAWSCGGPSSEVSFISLNSEGVPGFEFFNQQPADAEPLPRVIDSDSRVSKNDLRIGNEYPEQQVDCDAVENTGNSCIRFACESKSENYPNLYSDNEAQINPVACRSESVVFRHVSKTTPMYVDQSCFTASQKGTK